MAAQGDSGRRGRDKKMGFGRSPAVLVVDMTYAYFDSDSPLGYGADSGWKAVEALRGLLGEARDRNVPIIYTRSAPLKVKKNELKGLGRKHTRPEEKTDHARMGTIVQELAPTEDDLVIDKFRASAFFGTPLISYLIFHRIDTLILTGTSTSGCVRTTAAEASSYNYHVVIPQECVFDREPLWHEVTLAVLGQKYADVVSTAETVSYLQRPVEAPLLG
jgi:nicotinamidase-related amidase